MNTIEYKGFTISSSRVFHGGKENVERFFVLAEGFNPDGYSNVGGAKGAITKALKEAVASAVTTSGSVPVADLPAHFKAHTDTARGKPATSNDKDHASVPVGDLSADSDNLMALLRYNGFIKGHGFKVRQPDYRSRNRREGRYAGQVDGKPVRDIPGLVHRYCDSFTSGYYFPNRKARKLALMDVRNSTRQNAYGGRPVFKK